MSADRGRAGHDVVDLDARGLLCPEPVIRLARRLRGEPPGAVVRLHADDPAADTDVPAFCRMRGHALLSVDVDADGSRRFLVRQGG